MLDELTAIAEHTAQIVLIEDAVFALNHPKIAAFKNIAILSSDAHLLSTPIESTVRYIDYDELADFIAHAKKVITWK
ncbi:hypothetical protein F4V57_03445 [Acinetobacter qingfengensis]|nr:hypothetical protein [Acinetobacter qingfengensis]KAA8734828.1 hypothetical protein F4V57_03445 [Acinetobacter qingfengensis]